MVLFPTTPFSKPFVLTPSADGATPRIESGVAEARSVKIAGGQEVE